MPDVLIEVRGDWLKDRKVNFIEAVEDGIVAALQTPKDDKILRLTTRLGARVVAPKQYWRSA